MQYMGGKFRQSREICHVLWPYILPNTVYVEPFCGGMWSAARVAKELKPGIMILNDINKPLMLLWEKCMKDGVEWLPDYPDAEMYQWYKEHHPDNDPLTAYIGFGFSFGGAWFSTYIKPGTSHNGDQKKSIYNKIRWLRTANVKLFNTDYINLSIPDRAVVYLDPPYENRTKAHPFGEFDYGVFWDYVRDLSKRCTVFTSCYECPEDFYTIVTWGDTVHRYTDGKREKQYTDGTCERLVRFNEEY